MDVFTELYQSCVVGDEILQNNYLKPNFENSEISKRFCAQFLKFHNRNNFF